MSSHEIGNKGRFAVLMASDLNDRVMKLARYERENGRYPKIGYDVEKSSGLSKRQLLADITRLRRELQQLANLIEEEL